MCIKHLGPTKSDRTLHDYDLHGSSFTFEPACHLRKDKETCCRCLLYLSLSLLQLLCRVGFPSQQFVSWILRVSNASAEGFFKDEYPEFLFYSPWLMKMQVPFFHNEEDHAGQCVAASSGIIMKRARPAAMELWKHLVFADHGVIVASYYNSLTHNKFGSHVAYELSSFQSNGHW